MKKQGVFALLWILILSLALTGCGSTAADEKEIISPFVGKWVATEAEMNEIAIDVTDIAGDFHIVLDARGKVEATIETVTEKGTWEESADGKGFTVHLSDVDFVFTANEDGTMTTEYENIRFTFVQEEQNPTETERAEPLSDSNE